MSKRTVTTRQPKAEAPVLGLECATSSGGAALLQSDGICASRMLQARVDYSTRMLPLVDSLLQETGWPVTELAGVAVSLGPGSFTGVRVGISIAKGLCRAAGLPLLGVPTLEALAYRYFERGRDVCPLLDARRGEVYAALFSPDRSGRRLKRKMADIAAPLDAVLARIKRPTIFLGDGALRYRAELIDALGERALFAPPHRLLPSAEEVAALGLRRLAEGDIDDPLTLAPIYLRPPDAKPPRRVSSR